MDRRLFLRDSLNAGTLAMAAAAGILRPVTALAGKFDVAFQAESAEAALSGLLGEQQASPSDKVKVKAPEIAENGAKVPIQVETGLDQVESISIIVPKNPAPLIAVYEPGSEFAGMVNTRIKMRETSEVIALVRTPEGAFTAKADVKVTVGGCGG